MPYGGSLSETPYGWHLCDGSSGTPDLRDRFIVGAGKNYSLGNIGGENKHKLTIDEMPNHRHTYMWLNTKHQNNDSGSGYISEYDIYTDNIHVWNSFPYLYTTGVNKYNMSCTGGENPTCSLQETPIQPTLSMRYNRWIQRTSHAGEDKEHENRPPYYAVYYIMKIQ